MNKQEFLRQLSNGLSGLPQEDLAERLAFYTEMIDDRMEDGLPEEEAVREIGSVDALIAQTVSEIPLSKIVKEKITAKKQRKTGEIVLLALGSPLWLPILIAALAVILSLYVSVWAVLVAVWAVFLSFACTGPACAAAGIMFAVRGNVISGIAMIGAGLVCAGLAVLLFYGCKAATKGVLVLTKNMVIRLKNYLLNKENGK